jgi:hypothetical protein
MTDDFIPYGRTDFRTYIALHCIALHCINITIRTCIALHCIALRHCIACIALYCDCIALHYDALRAYWLNVMLIVRHVCSWMCHRSRLINSKQLTMIVILPPIGSVCLSVCFVFVRLFFGSGPPYGRTRLDYATELKLNWNNWNLSVHPWHSYILTFYIDISILARGKMTSFQRPSVRTFRFPF